MQAQEEKSVFVLPIVDTLEAATARERTRGEMSEYDFDDRGRCRHCRREAGESHRRDCVFTERAWWEWHVPFTDLRSITRYANISNTLISVGKSAFDINHPWIHCGILNVNENQNTPGQVELRAYLGRGATDFEHDSAYAFAFKVIGWQFAGLHRYSIVEFRGWVAPRGDADDFRVPSPGYNPFEGKLQGPDGRGQDVHTCSGDPDECKWGDGKEHQIVDYLPEPNPELYERLRGCPIRVRIGPTFPKEER